MEEEVLEQEIQVQEEMYRKGGDMTNYYTKEETNELLETKANTTDIPDISGKQDTITTTNKLDSDLVDDTNKTNLFVTSTEKTTWNAKQNALTFDTVLTANSNNPVTSDGIKTAIDSAGGGRKIIYYSPNLTYRQQKTVMQEWYDEYVAGNQPLLCMTELADGDVSAFGFVQFANFDLEETGAEVKDAGITAFANTYGTTKPGTVPNTSYLFLNMYQIYVVIRDEIVEDVQLYTEELGYIPTSYDFADKAYVDSKSLGRFSDHTTQAKAIDLTNLDVGNYYLMVDQNGNNLYLKANSFTTSKYYTFSGQGVTNKTMCISIIKKVSEVTTSGETIGYASYVYIDNSNNVVSQQISNIKLYSTYLEFGGSGSNYTLKVVTTNDAQTITAKKTFNTLPESSVVPTTDNQLVNKKYVDDAIATALANL